jgi:hypothetical protein
MPAPTHDAAYEFYRFDGIVRFDLDLPSDISLLGGFLPHLARCRTLRLLAQREQARTRPAQ